MEWAGPTPMFGRMGKNILVEEVPLWSKGSYLHTGLSSLKHQCRKEESPQYVAVKINQEFCLGDTEGCIYFSLNCRYILLGVIRFLTKNCVTDYDCKREHDIPLFLKWETESQRCKVTILRSIAHNREKL